MKMDSALNNLQRLIYHKTKSAQTKVVYEFPYIYIYIYIYKPNEYFSNR